MAIKEYFDGETKLYNVRVAKRSPEVKGLVVSKKSTRVESLKEAKLVERKLEREVERILIEREQAGHLWETLVSEWELAARADDVFVRKITKSTVEDYVMALRKHTAEWMNLSVCDIDRAMGWRLLDRIDREHSISRRKRVRTSIDAVFKWAINSGRLQGINSLPTDGYVGTSKEEEKMPEILNLTEIREFLKAAHQAESFWYPIWAMALLTGLRSGELFALRWDKIDLDSDLLYIHENWTSKDGMGPTKGRYWRTIPISPELKNLLKDLKLTSKGGYTDKLWVWKTKQRRERQPVVLDDFVLPRSRSWREGWQAASIRTFCVGVGLPSIKFHTLRSCFATQLIKDGIAPAVVMKICGWKDLKTMQRYIRLAGIEVKGATHNLKILPSRDVMGRVVELFKTQS